MFVQGSPGVPFQSGTKPIAARNASSTLKIPILINHRRPFPIRIAEHSHRLADLGLVPALGLDGHRGGAVAEAGVVELIVEIVGSGLATFAVHFDDVAEDGFAVAAEALVAGGDDPDVIDEEEGQAVADDGGGEGKPDGAGLRFATEEHLLEINAAERHGADIEGK